MNDEQRAEGAALLERICAMGSVKALGEQRGETDFAAGLGAISIDSVFTGLWARPGLDARSRSLVTLGILIALRSREELRIHAALAIANGVSLTELEEVIYHASGYAGFPAASNARLAAIEGLQMEGLI